MLWALSVSSFLKWGENSEGVARVGWTETTTWLARWAMRATAGNTHNQFNGRRRKTHTISQWGRRWSEGGQIGEARVWGRCGGGIGNGNGIGIGIGRGTYQPLQLS